MGPRDRRERERENLRQEILDAARELFVVEGYENVSMRRIADRIDYSPTTIYLHFKDKSDLLYHICAETFARLSERLEAIYRECADPLECLKEGCRAYIEFGLKFPDHYKVTFINHPEHLKHDEHMPKEESAGMKTFYHLRQAVEECIIQGKFRETDVDMVSQMLWATGHGITSLLISFPDFPWADKERMIDLLLDTLVEGLKA